MALLLAVPQQTTLQTNVTIQSSDVTGTQITTHYDTMPGNQPNSYGNTLYLWQTGGQFIPPNTQPSKFQLIGANQPNGSSIFMGLDVSQEAYLVGYAVGNDPSNIVSTVFIPATGSGQADPVTVNSSIQVTGVLSTSVAFTFVTPPGQNPLAQGDWVGLWQGQSEGALYSMPPTWSAQVATSASQGNWGLNLVSGVIQRGTMYTMGYFKGGWSGKKQTTLAASTTFFG